MLRRGPRVRLLAGCCKSFAVACGSSNLCEQRTDVREPWDEGGPRAPATAGRIKRLSGGGRGAGGLEVQAAALPGRQQAGKAAAGDLGRCALAGPNNLVGAGVKDRGNKWILVKGNRMSRLTKVFLYHP